MGHFVHTTLGLMLSLLLVSPISLPIHNSSCNLARSDDIFALYPLPSDDENRFTFTFECLNGSP